MRRADENTLFQRGGVTPATALLVGDSGSERAAGAAWVDALDPRLALISVSAHSGLAPHILDRLARPHGFADRSEWNGNAVHGREAVGGRC